jgi:DNA replication protein DnaC
MSESKTTVKRDAEIEVPRNTTCLRCFRQVAPGDGVGSGIGFRCKSCSESERTREREALDETLGLRVKQFESMCPPLYRESDVKKLPNLAAHKRVMAWTWEKGRGLMLYGKTGTGKTRAAWACVRFAFVDRAVPVVAYTATEFGHQVAGRFHDGTAEEWIKGMEETGLLFIDDVGKFKLTDRVETELFHLIEHRTSHLRPFLLTTNASGREIESSMSENRGVPMLRRLREFCDIVRF